MTSDMAAPDLGKIICIGPNPSLDKTLVVAELVPGSVNRAEQVFAQPGGKAANVAKVVLGLGGLPVLVGPVGGNTGAEVQRLAEDAGLECRWSQSTLPTRMCTAIVGSVHGSGIGSGVDSDGGGVVTDINESGVVDEAGWNELLGIVTELGQEGWRGESVQVLLSGSLPAVAGREADVLMRELMSAVPRSVNLWVDTSGAALAEIIDGDRSIELVKVNLAEVLEYLGPDLDGAGLSADEKRLQVPSRAALGLRAAAELAKRTGGVGVVTLGADGAVLCDGERSWWGRVGAPEVLNPTGSGDSFFAGLAMGWRSGPVEALKLAMGCGASNAAHLWAGVINAEEVAELVGAVVVMEDAS